MLSINRNVNGNHISTQVAHKEASVMYESINQQSLCCKQINKRDKTRTYMVLMSLAWLPGCMAYAGT